MTPRCHRLSSERLRCQPNAAPTASPARGPARTGPADGGPEGGPGRGARQDRIGGVLLGAGAAHVMLQCAHDDERRHDGPSPEPGAARQAAETDREGVFHMSTTRPSESSAAWATASDMVGCAWIASSTSSTVYSFSRATASSWMISEACPPTMWAPRISPYFLSRRIFTNPSVSPVPRARPFAENGNRPAT